MRIIRASTPASSASDEAALTNSSNLCTGRDATGQIRADRWT